MSEKFWIIKISDFFFKKKNQITATWQQIKKLCRDVNMSWIFFAPKAKVWVLILEMDEENFKIRWNHIYNTNRNKTTSSNEEFH